MGDGFDVNVGEVRMHCTTVATYSSQVNAAFGAAQSSVHDNAYGVVGAFFAGAMMMASDQAREGILKAAKSLNDVQAGLKAVADLYQQVDDAHAQLLSLTHGGGK